MFIVSGHLRAFALIAAGCAATGALRRADAKSATAEAAATVSTPASQPVLLDRVIAVINGDVLLQSDLQSEEDMAALQPLSLPPGNDLDRRAARRLVNRVLILQQMKNQGMTKEVSDEDVQKDLDLLRKQIPACVQYQCQTDAGWAKFLGDHHLTADEVQAHWRQRMQILSFIDARFRAGLRISKVEDYYNKTFVPQFKKENANPPSLDSVSSRIEEVLLQQHVSVLLQDWLKSLRDQGNVIILDSALGESNPSPDDDDGGGR
jgi:peptidyl-prolyl cis-trans isomerase SurA